jgi:hypothetical protein
MLRDLPVGEGRKTGKQEWDGEIAVPFLFSEEL